MNWYNRIVLTYFADVGFGHDQIGHADYDADRHQKNGVDNTQNDHEVSPD